MPPVRMRERGRAKKGTMKRLVKKLFKEYPIHLVVSAICIIFNVAANLCSSIFAGLISGVLAKGIISYLQSHFVYCKLLDRFRYSSIIHHEFQ